MRIFRTRQPGTDREQRPPTHRFFGRLSVAMATLLFVLSGVVAAAQNPAPDEQPQRETIKELITQLDSESRTTRVEAEQQMLELGPAILPLLPPPDLIDSISAREAVRRIRLKLERQLAMESVKPAHVTIAGSQKFADVIEQIVGQTGNRISIRDLPDEILSQQIDVSFNQEQFWPALDEIMQPREISFDFAKTSAEIILSKRNDDEHESRVAYAGAFRLAAEPVQQREIFGDPQHQLFRIKLQLAAEPRLRPLFLRYATNDLSLHVTNNNRELVSLPSISPDARLERPLGEGGCATTMSLDFKAARDQSGTTAKLAGKFVLVAAAATEKIEFREFVNARGVARRRGGVTVIVKNVEVRKLDDGTSEARVLVTVGYDASNRAFESHHTWVFHNKVRVTADGEKEIEPDAGYQTTLQADGVVSVEYRFRGLSDNLSRYRFLYEAPILIVDVPVSFQISDIPFSSAERSLP